MSRTLKGALAAAAVGLVLSIAGAVVDPGRFFSSYLAAYTFAVTTAVGALIFLLICNVMRATWPVALRRLVEVMVGTLPLLAALFAPLLFGLDTLYPWIHPDHIVDEHARGLVEQKAAYLNVTSFLARGALYFILWIGAGEILRRLSLAKDRNAGLAVEGKMVAWSAAALPPVGLALTFASFDWLMSQSPLWHSTMFPVYVFAGGFVAAIAALTLVAFGADRAGLLPKLNLAHYYALGRLLLAFVIFWAYAAFFQLLIHWIADKPDEIGFYLARTRGGWLGVTVALVLLCFVAPFFALLGYGVKHRPRQLAAIAAVVLAGHYLDMHWLVMPAHSNRVVPFPWIDAGTLLAVSGITVAWAVLRHRGKALVPVNDPALPKALRYDSV